MSRKVSDNPQEWDEADVLYLHQFDQRTEEVKARAEELGVQLPQPTGLGAPSRPEGGLSDYSLDQLFTHLADRERQDPEAFAEASSAYAERKAELEGDTTAVVSEYDDMSKDELKEELVRRQIDYNNSATKVELVALLVADDEG